MAHDFAKQSKSKTSATRGQSKRKPTVESQSSFSWQWLLVCACLSIFAVLLLILKSHHHHLYSKHAAHLKATKHEKNKKNNTHPPKFDFYTILPKMKVWVPSTKQNAPSTTPVQPPLPVAYVLQVASFRQYKDADKLKAKLTLAGYNVAVKSNQGANGNWNRVWVGPFRSKQKAFEVEEKLAKQNLSGLILKIPE